MHNHFRIAVAAVVAPVVLALPASAQSCTGDVAVDSRVDGGDLGVLLANWGSVTSKALSRACDFDSNGQIDGADLGTLLANWGACSAPTWSTVLEADPDPAVVTDADLRAAIQATGLPWRVRDNGTGIELLLVPPGHFQMGCIMRSNQWRCEEREFPVHQVTLTHAFYLGRFEVTQAQWVARMGSNPSFFQGQSDSASRPVEKVSWNTIQGYLSATGFRLPTEAEWEYACRAGTQTPFHSGPGFPDGTTDNNLASQIGWFFCGEGDGCSTKPVGGKAANALGFHDMIGNVWEWVNDWHFPYTADPQINPTGPASAGSRALRGGSWQSGGGSSLRADGEPGISYNHIGFRVARTP